MSLIAEFTVPAEQFLLAETLREYPDLNVECEQLVPTHGQRLPFLWVTDDLPADFGETARGDSTVEAMTLVAELDGGRLYRVEWTPLDVKGTLPHHLAANAGTVLEADGSGDEWHLKMRFDDREELSSLHTFCEEHGITFDVVRLYDLTRPKMGQYNISEKQTEVLVLALEWGYFNIPRDVTLEDIAAELDLSTRAVSERLRRGLTNLLNNTVTIGQPSSIDVGENQ